MNVIEILKKYEDRIFCEKRVAFSLIYKGEVVAPNLPGIYVFFKDNDVVYVGESGCILSRMRDVKRTVNHTLRRAIGKLQFSSVEGYVRATSKKKYPEHIEEMVTDYMFALGVVFLPIEFGRTETEEYLVEKYNPTYNTKRKRKNAITKLVT